jgi:putative restriction endonuclease
MVTDKYGDRWSREESILALYLYCQIPFAKTKANNPEVITLANLIGRTPASVARKLGNFGAFDPLLASQGISGLTHAGRAARQIWDEFHGRWADLVQESARLLQELSAPAPRPGGSQAGRPSEDEAIIALPTGPSERPVTAVVRLFQSFFRRAVLASYESTCCVCGLDIRPLLVASHIKPWAKDESTRSDPANGLCLCAIHDRAFDSGFIAISGDLRVLVLPKILPSQQPFVRAALVNFHCQPLRMPTRFAPREDLLAWHRQEIFARRGC